MKSMSLVAAAAVFLSGTALYGQQGLENAVQEMRLMTAPGAAQLSGPKKACQRERLRLLDPAVMYVPWNMPDTIEKCAFRAQVDLEAESFVLRQDRIPGEAARCRGDRALRFKYSRRFDRWVSWPEMAVIEIYADGGGFLLTSLVKSELAIEWRKYVAPPSAKIFPAYGYAHTNCSCDYVRQNYPEFLRRTEDAAFAAGKKDCFQRYEACRFTNRFEYAKRGNDARGLYIENGHTASYCAGWMNAICEVRAVFEGRGPK